MQVYKRCKKLRVTWMEWNLKVKFIVYCKFINYSAHKLLQCHLSKKYDFNFCDFEKKKK